LITYHGRCFGGLAILVVFLVAHPVGGNITCIAGSKAIICASTGNTSASAAAYAARAGIKAFVLIPEGKIALGKLAQAICLITYHGRCFGGLAILVVFLVAHPVGGNITCIAHR
jgi:hypothetical protein